MTLFSKMGIQLHNHLVQTNIEPPLALLQHQSASQTLIYINRRAIEGYRTGLDSEVDATTVYGVSNGSLYTVPASVIPYDVF